MQRIKRSLTWVLLIFTAAAIVTALRPRETVFVPDGLCLLFWHAEVRCPACLKMESLIRQTLQKHDNFHLIDLEYDIAANQSLAAQFHVGTATIILVERKDQQTVRYRNLTAEVWKYLEDDFAFKTMLRDALENFCTN